MLNPGVFFFMAEPTPELAPSEAGRVDQDGQMIERLATVGLEVWVTIS